MCFHKYISMNLFLGLAPNFRAGRPFVHKRIHLIIELMRTPFFKWKKSNKFEIKINQVIPKSQFTRTQRHRNIHLHRTLTGQKYLAATRCNTTLQHAATLQHTATHYNTLQYTTTHYNTLQHTASHCNKLHYTVTHCNTLQHTATHCNTLQHTATHCLHSIACCRTMWSRTATHCNALHHTATNCITL